MNWKDYLKFDLKQKNKHKVITLGYAVAIIFAFVLSLTNNNYVEASVSKSERLDFQLIENNIAENLSDPESVYPAASIDNINGLFSMVNSLVREKDVQKNVEVQKGDTLISVLTNLGFDRNAANDIYYKLKEHYDPRDLKAGQELSANLTIDTQTDDILRLNALVIEPEIGEKVVVSQNEAGEYLAEKIKDELITEISNATGIIEGNLSTSMQKHGVPLRVVNKFIQIFAYSVDFRRDLRKGDKFEIIYENQVTPDGENVKAGNIIYAGLVLRNTRISLYRYEDKKGNVDYYNEKGRPMKKILYKMPLNYAARISSPFGKRRHPILKDIRIHWGVDYAAPSGTPVLAGGDGVVQVAKYNGAYGNYVKIRHNSEFATAYGHMKGFAKGIRPGVRVKQGQVIGYVGSTGRATGPHVHYEVVHNGRRVNPRTIKASTGENLKGQNLKNFKVQMANIKKSYANMFAQNDPQKMAQK